MKNNRGFTLIEILVALMIFAIMGVLAAMSLHSIIRLHQKLNKTDHQLLQLQITMTLLRRDISQIINRKIRDADGAQEAAFVASDGITFTRTGLVNPFNANRQSNMQRISYVLQGEHLARLTWDVLDQPPKAKPESQIILSGVQSIEWQFIADNGAKSSTWPPAVGSNMQKETQSPLPKVVLMVMHVKNEGVIQGVFPIPARGTNATPQSETTPP
jgi:general secretion pathway protein J